MIYIYIYITIRITTLVCLKRDISILPGIEYMTSIDILEGAEKSEKSKERWPPGARRLSGNKFPLLIYRSPRYSKASNSRPTGTTKRSKIYKAHGINQDGACVRAFN